MTYEMEALIPIVAKLAEKYTQKDSTSITYEMAKQLMQAVIYCIDQNDYAHSPLHTAYSQSGILANKLDAASAYQRGYELILQKISATKKLYETIMTHFDSYGNIAYHDTIIEGIPAFFLHYDVKFKPQDHFLTLDYPTIKGIQGICGIDAIYEYLNNTHIEQQFLHCFPRDLIINLLFRFHPHHEELFINISSLVLRNVIGCFIVGKKVETLRVDPSDYQSIKDWVQPLSNEHLQEKLASLIESLITTGYQSASLVDYFKTEASDFSFELLNALRHGSLKAIFP